MKKGLLFQACAKFASGIAALALLLFLPAGTLAYANAWLLMGLLFVPMSIMGIVLYTKAPELLKKRLSDKENEKAQGAVIALSAAMFAAGFVTAGLDFRFGWSRIPNWGIGAASLALLIGYGLFAEVMRENAYLSRTVEVQKDQKVVDTGLYGVVRHPMYFATVLLFWSFPVVLGSAYAFLVFLPYPLLLVKRIQNEEEVLEKGLAGYAEYKKRVKYRLIPFVW